MVYSSVGDNRLHSSKRPDDDEDDDSLTDIAMSSHLISQTLLTITGCEYNTVHSSQGFEVVLISDLWYVANFVRVMISGETKNGLDG